MKFIIGDTPQQLAVCATADAMMIDGKIVTKADHLALVAQLTALKTAVKPIIVEYFDWVERNQIDIEDCNQSVQELYRHMVALNNCYVGDV